MARLQINLLPDIKLQANKQQHTRNLVVTGASLVAGACFAIFLLMAATVYIIQKQQLKSSNDQIQTAQSQLDSVPNLNEVLTIQNQLKALVTLHSSKHITSRLFDYLGQMTPVSVTINSASADMGAGTMHVSGNADSQHSVNVFADTIKFTQYKLGNTVPKQAFSGVVEDSFGLSSSGVTYSLSFKFDPKIFANSQVDNQGKVATPILVVPKKTTTRSAINDPGSAFGSGSGQ